MNKRRCLNCKQWFRPVASSRIYCSQPCAKAHIPLRKRITDEELISKFHAKCVKRENGCIEWIGGIGTHGYGRLNFNGKQMLAHRFAYWRKHGAVPVGLLVCHHCDNKLCVRPSHLFIGTQADNLADMSRKGRSNRGERGGTAKLTNAEVLAIRADKRVQVEIANKYCISQATVSGIKQRHLWTHI